MSKALTRRQAAIAFANGDNPRTACALTFSGPFAYSYAEPIAFRDGCTLYASNVGRVKGEPSASATFSMTTAHHMGQVAGQWAVANGVENVVYVPHAAIRERARTDGFPVGPAGAKFDA